MLIRRTALELVGDFDLAFTPGYGEEVDFSQRCLLNGLCHVLADDVLVFHHGGGSFSRNGEPSPVQEEHERILAARYPYYHRGVVALEEDRAGPLARSLSSARRALKGLSVAIDARILVGPTTGTQLHVVELIGALARTREARITVIVPDRAERVGSGGARHDAGGQTAHPTADGDPAARPGRRRASPVSGRQRRGSVVPRASGRAARSSPTRT